MSYNAASYSQPEPFIVLHLIVQHDFYYATRLIPVNHDVPFDSQKHSQLLSMIV